MFTIVTVTVCSYVEVAVTRVHEKLSVLELLSEWGARMQHALLERIRILNFDTQSVTGRVRSDDSSLLMTHPEETSKIN